MQVHKETIDKIPGAVPGRDNVNIEVYGMEGLPPDAFVDFFEIVNGNNLLLIFVKYLFLP